MSSTTATAPVVPVAAGSRRAPAQRRIVLLAVALGVIAIAVRIGLVEAGPGIAGTGNYDDGVYFGATEALLHGRLPYLDYLFLQPPGILLALSPFAALAPWIGDAHAFEAARLAGYLFAGLTTALLVLAMRRVGPAAAATTGVVFALIEPAVFTSRTTLLEPVGALVSAAVLAVFAGAAPQRGRGRVLAVLCGVLLGFSIGVKIWAVATTLVFVLAARRRHPLLIAAGALAAVVALFLPFFLADPEAMWREVVLDQLGRQRLDPVLLERLADVVQTPLVLGGAEQLTDSTAKAPPVLLGLDLHVVTAVLLVVVLAAAVAGRRYPIVRISAVQFLVSVLVLLAGPSFYDHYALLATPFLAVVIGGGVAGVLRRVRAPRMRRGLAVVAIVLTAAYCLVGLVGSGATYMLNPTVGTPILKRVAALHGCVLSDDPTVLVLTNRLSRDLAAGCPFWPDLTGWSLDADRPPADVDPDAFQLQDDAAYQRRMAGYFTSGNAVVLGRFTGRLSLVTLAKLQPLVYSEHGRYLVTPPNG